VPLSFSLLYFPPFFSSPPFPTFACVRARAHSQGESRLFPRVSVFAFPRALSATTVRAISASPAWEVNLQPALTYLCSRTSERASERAGAVCILVARLSARAGPRYFPREEKVTHGEKSSPLSPRVTIPAAFRRVEWPLCGPRAISNSCTYNPLSSCRVSRDRAIIRLAALSTWILESALECALDSRWIRNREFPSTSRDPRGLVRFLSIVFTIAAPRVSLDDCGRQLSLDSFRCARGRAGGRAAGEGGWGWVGGGGGEGETSISITNE
jgi:hypothetical protein